MLKQSFSFHIYIEFRLELGASLIAGVDNVKTEAGLIASYLLMNQVSLTKTGECSKVTTLQ